MDYTTPEVTVDVVLPLAAPGTFTYALPAEAQATVGVGSRVVVPFGARRYYTAIVIRRPGTPPPDGVALKSVTEVVDDAPMFLPLQIKMWQWMADYYMCTLGEVMTAAMPSGLKMASDTFVTAADDDGDDAGLSPLEADIMHLLREPKPLSIDQVRSRMAGRRGTLAALRRLMQTGRAEVSENLTSTFRPRTETHVRLTPAFAADDARIALLDSLRRAPKQHAVAIEIIDGGPMSMAALSRCVPEAAAAVAALRKKGALETFDVVVDRRKAFAAGEPEPPHPLAEGQKAALADILKAFTSHNVCLLHGVTASGKTEVYIELIRRTLAEGRQVLYLVPEIALTTQIMQRLGRIFGDRMGVYHSKFPDAERVELWQRQLTDRAYPLILGVRSSLFLPFKDLGLVIVDEEHETSYKQQEPAPRYNARDAAIVLAQAAGAKVLLGTATPAVETYYNATVARKYGLAEMTERYGGVRMPEIVVEDVKELKRKKLMKTPFSPRLIEETRAALAAGEQAIFFQNRRGYAPVIECRACGWTPHCRACDVPLTYHRHEGRLVCHYCGATYAVPERCPNCEETDLREIGYGTERIEDIVADVFPEANVARMDLDTTRSRTAYERLIADFQARRTNLLIGTQMVTKGLDFDHVRVVGILNADQMLNQPNFRAFERAFQMMSQVAGRAGRRDRRGIVILQTKQATLPIVRQVAGGDYAAMFGSQLVEREMFSFPPFVRVIEVWLRHRDERVCLAAAEELARLLTPAFGDDLLGPDRPAVGRVRYQHLQRLMLKVRPQFTMTSIRRTLTAARDALLSQKFFGSVGVWFDVDPL